MFRGSDEWLVALTDAWTHPTANHASSERAERDRTSGNWGLGGAEGPLVSDK